MDATETISCEIEAPSPSPVDLIASNHSCRKVVTNKLRLSTKCLWVSSHVKDPSVTFIRNGTVITVLGYAEGDGLAPLLIDC